MIGGGCDVCVNDSKAEVKHLFFLVSTAQSTEVDQIFGKISGKMHSERERGGFVTKLCHSLHPTTPFPKPPPNKDTHSRLHWKPVVTTVFPKFFDNWVTYNLAAEFCPLL